MRILPIILLCVLSLTTDVWAVRQIIGASVDIGVIAPPTGLCTSGTFAMSNAGTMVFVDNTTLIQLGLGPFENSNDGVAYFNTGTSTSDTRQSVIDMQTLVVSTSGNINVANVPDSVTFNRASHYNPFESAWVVVGRQNSGVACGGTVCVHIRTYFGGVTPLVDVITDQPSGSGPNEGPYIDDVNTYILSNITGGQNLAKLTTTAYTTVDTVFVADSGTSGSVGLAGDNTYIYGAQNVSARILRWLKSNISGGATAFSPGLTAGTLQAPTGDNSVGFIYVPTRSGGASVNVMYRVRTSDMTIQGQVTLGNTQFLGKVLVDSVNDKLYLVTSSAMTQNQIVRVNRTTLAVEETYNGVSQANGPNLNFAQIDVPHQKIYVPINGTGAAETTKLEKVNLCS